MERLMVGGLTIDVEKKSIKNLHLSVLPPHGRVRISAPLRMNMDTIRLFAISKLGWIRKQRNKQQAQARETKRDYVTRESHYYLGKRYLLKVVETHGSADVELKGNSILLLVRKGASRDKRKQVLEAWYREQLKILIHRMADKWQQRIGVNVRFFRIRKMKTKWGSCNVDRKSILLNLELAKKPVECIEYILIHEMIHFRERKHNNRFQGLIQKFLPDWKSLKVELNKLPISKN